VLTVINETRRNKARPEAKANHAHDFRHKKTRAFRRRLTKNELSLRTLRQQKKQDNFRQRKFALAA
jgi:large subunit ribosomal protein L35e